MQGNIRNEGSNILKGYDRFYTAIFWRDVIGSAPRTPAILMECIQNTKEAIRVVDISPPMTVLRSS
jgi:hypothetical protein